MKNRFTKKEVEIMKTLWNHDKPLIASDIVNLNSSLNINTVQAGLRTLISKDAIKVADIVHSGTVLTRCYTPIISKEEYFDAIYKDIIGDEKNIFSLIKSLIDTKTTLDELEELEQIITRKKRELLQGDQD